MSSETLRRILFEDFFDTRESAILNDYLITSNLKRSIITVDIEWTSKFKTDTSTISLVQIGLRNELTLIFDVLKSPQYLDEYLKYIFQDYNVIKIVLSDHDASVLLENGIFMVNTIDLEQVYKKYCTLLKRPENGGINELCSILKIISNPFKNTDEDKYWLWAERPITDEALDCATYDAWFLWGITFGVLKLTLKLKIENDNADRQFEDRDLDNLFNSSNSSICKFEKGFVEFHRKVGNCYKMHRDQVEKNAQDNSYLLFKYDVTELGYLKHHKSKNAESTGTYPYSTSNEISDNVRNEDKDKVKVKVKAEEKIGWCSWFMRLLGKFFVLIIIISLFVPQDSQDI